jgi:hypothetical protein
MSSAFYSVITVSAQPRNRFAPSTMGGELFGYDVPEQMVDAKSLVDD